MSLPIENIVIAGAGQAGGRAAEALRAAGFRGGVTMIGDEAHPPYERPQLSKAMLSTPDSSASYLRPASDWKDVLNIDLVIGTAVAACDPDRRVISTVDGRDFAYDRFLIATGTRPRCLAALEASSLDVQYLRNIEDALRLRQTFHNQAATVIVGGGVIGLEAACAAAKHGCRVTVVENESRLLARAFPAIISDIVLEKHRGQGVDFIFGATVTGASPSGVQLSNGQSIPADVVLVGIGVEPMTAVAEQIGLPTVGGIATDARGRTAAPDAFCAGDVALQWSHCHDRHIRVETWANAQNQAISVARNMIGDAAEYTDPSWFWTDQYDLNIQVAGDMLNCDHVLRGDPRSGRFSVIALRDAEIVGATSVNSAKDMAMLRRLIAARARPDRSYLASAAYDLRGVLKR